MSVMGDMGDMGEVFNEGVKAAAKEMHQEEQAEILKEKLASLKSNGYVVTRRHNGEGDKGRYMLVNLKGNDIMEITASTDVEKIINDRGSQHLRVEPFSER